MQIHHLNCGCMCPLGGALFGGFGLRAYQWMMEVDRKARLLNQGRLHTLSIENSKDVSLFCGHDAIELKAFADDLSSSQS